MKLSPYQFILILASTIVMIAVLAERSSQPVYAQAGMPIILNVQSSITGCAWPTGYATVQNGMAICPVNSSGVLSLALAINGGAFQMISGGGGSTASTIHSITGKLVCDGWTGNVCNRVITVNVTAQN